MFLCDLVGRFKVSPATIEGIKYCMVLDPDQTKMVNQYLNSTIRKPILYLCTPASMAVKTGEKRF